MQRNQLPLSALRAFEAAARLGSFKQAADDLAVTPTAISHQIRALEEQLGLALFDRQVRKVVLTEAGAQLYPVLRDGFDAFAATLERLLQKRLRAQVSISATNAFTVKWLVPRMASFRAMHPEVDLQLQARTMWWTCAPMPSISPCATGAAPIRAWWPSPCSATALRPWPIPGWACWVRPTWPACR